MRTGTQPHTHTHSCGALTQALHELYDKIGHTKKMGVVYTGSIVTDVRAGLAAERQGVCVGWKFSKVCRVHAGCTPCAA